MSRLIACQSKHTTSISLTMAPCSAYQCNGPHYSNPRSSSTNGRNSRAISQRLAVPNHWSMVEHHRLYFSWYFILTVIKRPFVWPYSDEATPFGLQSDPRKIAITPNNIRQNHPSISHRPIGITKNHSHDNVGHLGGRQNGVTYFNNHECFSFQLIKNVIC